MYEWYGFINESFFFSYFTDGHRYSKPSMEYDSDSINMSRMAIDV
jgi:hypothetical protein